MRINSVESLGKVLFDRVTHKERLSKRVERLDEKLRELFTKHDSVRRYVAMQHLRSTYKTNINDLRSSVESIACRIVTNHKIDAVQTSLQAEYDDSVRSENEEKFVEKSDERDEEKLLQKELEDIP